MANTVTSNLVVNLNKIRAANVSVVPERGVFIFDYFASQSATGQSNQRPLVRVINGSLERTTDGDWMFRGVNLYRINDRGKGISGAIRTYRLSRINGVVRQP
jgi:hypothetical protein